MVKDVINTNKRLRGKLYGIVSNFRPSTARDAFEGKIADFESLVRRKHTKIAKIEDKVIEDIAAKTKDPATALRLIEGFIDTGSSEAADDKTFVRFLSTHYALQSKGSLLGQALERMRESAGEGGLAKNFLQSKMEEREGDNLYAYMARKLESAGLLERFDDVFARDFSEWPADMRTEYEEFTNQYLTSLSTSVHRIASQNIAKLWVRPSKAMCETFLDDLFHRFHGKYSASSVQKLAQSERQGTMRIGANVQISVIDGVQNTDTQSKKEKLEPKTLGVIAKGMNGVAVWQHEGISTEDVIKLFIKDHKISREFRSELITIIEKIRREPFGEGTQLLRLGKRKPDSTKFYRINPVQAGMPVADAKKARVIYALNGDQLGIYSITNNHDEYERVIRDLLGSKM